MTQSAAVAVRARLLVTFLLLSAFPACAAQQRTAFDPRAGGQQAPTILEIVNRASLDMGIYVLPEVGLRERLGTATALSTTRLSIPSRLITGVTSMTFQADPIGSTRVQSTQDIAVIPGDTIVLEIPPG